MTEQEIKEYESEFLDTLKEFLNDDLDEDLSSLGK